MKYILKNILNNKLSSSIFILINTIVLLSIILCGAIIRETIQLNNDVNRRIDNGIQLKLNFKEKIELEKMNYIIKSMFDENVYEVGRFGSRIGVKYTTIVGMNHINSKMLNLISGAYISEEAISKGDNKALIGKFYEEYIVKKNGKKYIEIFGKEYEVIGIMGNQYGNSYYDNIIYVPFMSLPNDILKKNV